MKKITAQEAKHLANQLMTKHKKDECYITEDGQQFFDVSHARSHTRGKMKIFDFGSRKATDRDIDDGVLQKELVLKTEALDLANSKIETLEKEAIENQSEIDKLVSKITQLEAENKASKKDK